MIGKCRESQQVESAGALDLASDLAVELCRNSSRAARIDLAGLSREFAEELGIEVADLLRGNVEAPTRHAAVGAAEIDSSLFGFRAHDIEVFQVPGKESALLAVESAALEVGVELNLLETTRGPQTLLVAGRDIDGGTGAFFLGFRAFEDDDFSGHGSCRRCADLS